MKIWVILCLAAGPLAVRAQQAAGSGLARPGRGNSGGWLDSVSLGWRPPAVKIGGTAGSKPWSVYDGAVPTSLWARNSVRILMPDHMACLVTAGADAMPVDRRKGRDPMPNGLKRVIIVTETKP